MKQAIFAATLLAGLAAAHGDGLAAVHKRQHNRIATQHTDVTTTTTTTIWVPHPSDAASGQQQQPANPPTSGANPPASSVSVNVPSSSASSGTTQTTQAPQVKAANQPGSANFDPNAWQSSQAAIQSSLIASQEAVNSKQMSINGLPPQSASVQSAPTQTVPTQSAPVQSSQPASSSSGAQPTGGAGGSHSTHLTYYNAGPAACGGTYTDDDPIVAMAAAQLKCGAKMKITGPAGTFTATAVDKCGACEADGHIDGAYNFAYKISGAGRDQGALYQNGQVPITWEWV